MFQLWWPLCLTVAGNVAYQLGARMVSSTMHPLSALTLTYLVAAVVSFLLYGMTSEKGKRREKIFSFSPAAAGLGISIVAMELGNIYMYRAGWEVSTAFIAISAAATAGLLVAGTLLFHENCDKKKVWGILLSFAGVVLIIW